MDNRELKKIKRKFLKRSLKKQLINECGYSPRYVNYVLNGDRQNDLIIQKALDILNNQLTTKQHHDQ
jgi:hypothetical protein